MFGWLVTCVGAICSADNEFGGVVLVAQGDKIIVEQAYGFADQDSKIQNTLDTRFCIASVSKQFTAAAVLLLCEQGKIRDVHDPVCNYLPDFPHKKVTIHQLLSNTAGIVNIPNFPVQKDAAGNVQYVFGLEDGYLATCKEPLIMAPGTAYYYSNAGFLVLTKLIAVASGTDFATFMQDNIFAPVGTTTTGWGFGDEALGVVATTGMNRFIFKNPLGTGNMTCSARDLFKLVRSLYCGKLLKPATKEIMFASVKKSYACGILVEQEPCHMLWHRGGANGFSSYDIYYPELDVTIIVLANKGEAANIVCALHEHLMPGVPFYTLDLQGNRVGLKKGSS